MKVVIIDYGAGNIKSIQFAFQRLGINTELTSSKSTILKADKVIFPGVGEASSAMNMLQHSSLDRLIPNLQQPVLGICLGMQLLCKYTEEGSTHGLGIFDVKVKKFDTRVKVPQVGWNVIKDLKSDVFVGIPEKSYMYLVHSYYAEICDETISKTDYGLEYTSALQKKNFYGVQFHPEKSGDLGEQILKNFIEI
ncbi:imidazole glycerol phosphate synthase subunit HisH [Mangrovimonas spongiae]|uniref:Imidazole glycerol phosphate synthase subunit HisH n=1 Tax=Mangrovimonas spongiae TaxID=2494697 RepID=A0A428JX97_9FLAO|nr:imidazole glycerol phosphate synthase subunit HisH [Mangrovimonas spongiae]RSK38686.1 imidazole glycerol phosphate synthase subunit HisH [Mangrovimonas spongiae]